MSDNTTAAAATSGDLRRIAQIVTAIGSPHYARMRRIEATADALDALRIAVKGCGHEVWRFDTCQSGNLCERCRIKRDAAISALVGEGGSNG